eukprot:COSAG06_NODE_250_length_19080_cov_6.483029_4_plen_176_part_00
MRTDSPEKNGLFFEFFLCLSRACLGKKIAVYMQMARKVRFSHSLRRSNRAAKQQDKTRQDKTKTRQDKTRQGKTRQRQRQDKTRQDKARQDKTRQDKQRGNRATSDATKRHSQLHRDDVTAPPPGHVLLLWPKRCACYPSTSSCCRTMRMKISNQFAPFSRLFGGKFDWVSSNAS